MSVRGKKLTAREKTKFIEALRVSANVTNAAAAIKTSRASMYKVRDADADFKAAWDDAIEEAVDVLEEEARRRALKGTKRPIYQQGALVGYVQEYSDQLMTLLLRAHRPRKYRERLSVGGEDDGKPVVVRHVVDDPDHLDEVLTTLESAGALPTRKRRGKR
jgi:hypothetical protein